MSSLRARSHTTTFDACSFLLATGAPVRPRGGGGVGKGGDTLWGGGGGGGVWKPKELRSLGFLGTGMVKYTPIAHSDWPWTLS